MRISTIGSLTLRRDGEELPLPASRKTRALLAYLSLTGRAHSRQSLCELLWDVPDDPRGALRWSLSKLRPLLTADGVCRLVSDREKVELDLQGVEIDIFNLRQALGDNSLSPETAQQLWEQANAPLLEDCEIANQHGYITWLEQERNELVRMRTLLARKFASDCTMAARARDRWCERWLSDAPYDTEAALLAIETRREAGMVDEAGELAMRLRQSFAEAGIGLTIPTPAPALPDEESQRAGEDEANLPRQSIRFVQSEDGVSIAWAQIGERANPPLVKAANWLNHLELDWGAPIWSPLFRALASTFNFVRYDERGCGLSDWDVDHLNFDDFVTDLKMVVDAAGLERFPLLGISQGGAVSIEFAARYPDRVSHLVLFGAYDAGWRLTASDAEAREREAVMILTQTGWGSPNPAYRQIFSRTFMPDATAEELEWFDEFQRQTTSPANAVRFLEAFSRIDVRDRLAEISCPTLVVHSQDDLRIPMAVGRSLAKRIPNARFASLASSNHLLLGREAASERFRSLITDFVQQ